LFSQEFAAVFYRRGTECIESPQTLRALPRDHTGLDDRVDPVSAVDPNAFILDRQINFHLMLNAA
jgi:hypothetical protein